MRIPFRKILIDGDVAHVPLTMGKFAKIDRCDIDLVHHWNWRCMVHRNTCYAVRSITIDGKKSTILMHRVLLDAGDGFQVDHINRDGLDNTRKNIRLATASQNRLNQGVRSDSRSGLKGAFWSDERLKWRSHITVDGSKVYLGSYDAPEDAHAAYARASREFHGEFGSVK